MSDRARAYWRLLDTVEDYLRYGERTAHQVPERIGLPAQDEADQPPRRAPVVRGGAEGRAADALAALRADEPSDDPDRAMRLRRLGMLSERVRACTRCPLHEGRMQAVPGEGVLDPQVMVVGEAPGADEDRRGLPFVGKAGQFLDRWLEAIDLTRRRTAYIVNVVKCRPPGNRDPRPHESEACLPYLREQIDLVRPRAIMTVGRVATGILIGTNAGITSLRGRMFYFNGIPLIPTFHPAAVLRDAELKRPVWEDLKRMRELLDRGPTGG